MRSRSGRELDQALRLVDGDVLAVDVPRVQLRHAHDLVLPRAADLEAAGATQAFQLRHRPLSTYHRFHSLSTHTRTSGSPSNSLPKNSLIWGEAANFCRPSRLDHVSTPRNARWSCGSR